MFLWPRDVFGEARGSALPGHPRYAVRYIYRCTRELLTPAASGFLDDAVIHIGSDSLPE